ncbi:hypothetical protein [Pradoshia sp.]
MSDNKVSIGSGSWFNKINQGDNNGGSNLSVWKIAGGVLAALAAIAGIIGLLVTLGIISVN